MSVKKSTVRLYDLAKELKMDVKRLVEDARREGVDVSVPSNSISNQFADKIRNQYSQKKTTDVKRKIKLLHNQLYAQGSIGSATGGATSKPQVRTIQFKGPLPKSKAPPFKLVSTPATTPAPLPRRQKHRTGKRTCPMCGIEFPSKSEIRQHYVAHHIDEIIKGNVVCKVKVAELSQALNLSKHQVTEFAQRIGVKIRGGSYIQAVGVKRLASKIRTAVAREATDKHGKPPKRQEIPNRRIGTIATLKTGVRFPASKSKLLQAMADGLPTSKRQRVKWRFLPPGKRPFDEIIRNLNKAAKKYGKEIYEVERLTRIDELGPMETWIGDAGFRGYVAFVFDRYSCVVLECPRTNNAVYIFGENWKLLSRLTKSELLNTRRRELERVIHSDGWFFRLSKLLADRKK